jgi:hypothetical protein
MSRHTAPETAVSLRDIELMTHAYATIRADLDRAVRVLERRIADIRAKHRPAILRLIEEEREALADLEGAIAAAEHLFQRPKTRVFSGIKVGIVKRAGQIRWDDAAAVVAAIRATMPEREAVLVRVTVTEEPVRTALRALDDDELAALGARREADCEDVIVQAVKSDLERLIEALVLPDPAVGESVG